MIAAALDVIIGAWLVIYVVPATFDKDTGPMIPAGIIVLGVLHIARRVG